MADYQRPEEFEIKEGTKKYQRLRLAFGRSVERWENRNIAACRARHH